MLSITPQNSTNSYQPLLKSLMIFFFFSMLFMGLSTNSIAQKKNKFDYIFTIATDYGEIKFILFDETPKHKANFLKLVMSGYYDGTTFHRVLDNFMIQGGDPNSKEGMDGALGEGGPGYQIDAEISTNFKHAQGMIGAARLRDELNPDRQSSGCQFYIVENKNGAHHLDGKYTLFGQVIEGLEVIEQIANQKVDRNGEPVTPIRMTIGYVKLKKKQVTKTYGITYSNKKK